MDGRQITALLNEAAKGREGAFDEVVELVYADLERMARRHVRERERAAGRELTLEPAALVNEAYVKLLQQRTPYRNRHQFFAIATKVMLRILTDYHRARAAKKRGGGIPNVTLSGLRSPAMPDPMARVPVLIEAIEQLEALDERKADVLKLRGLWGLSTEQTATALDVSPATVDRDWQFVTGHPLPVGNRIR